jgi:hypothetical protein
MKFEVGKHYRTRNGERVRCIAIDGHVKYPIIVLKPNVGWTRQLTDIGRLTDDFESGWDVVSEWSEPLDLEMWVVLESDGSKIFCSTFAQADYNSEPDDGDRIIKVRVTEVVE